MSWFAFFNLAGGLKPVLAGRERVILRALETAHRLVLSPRHHRFLVVFTFYTFTLRPRVKNSQVNPFIPETRIFSVLIRDLEKLRTCIGV